MSLLLYSKIPGTQVKRDANLSNATVQCDPKLLFPRGALQGGVPLNKENLAGKIAVEHDLCNLDVNNLTVNGTLISNGPAQICDIVCPEDFTVTAGNNIIETATNGDMSLLAPAGDIVENAGVNVTLTAGTGQMVLTSGTQDNTQNLSGVKVTGNNVRSNTTTGIQSGASLNVFTNQVAAKGLAVVTKHDTLGVHAIAADLTGTTILRADTAGSNIGATGHLMFAPARDEDPTLSSIGANNAATFVGFASDSCGQIRVTSTGLATAVTVQLLFAKTFPTSVLNVFLTPASRSAAAVFGSATGCYVSATGINGFDVSFTSPAATPAAPLEVDFNYFVVDVVEPATQIG
jgi:hypothetical protein